MFERIVLAVDGSAYSERAAAAATEIAERFKADVLVIHVQEIPTSWAYDIDPALTEDGPGTELVEKVVRELKERGVAATGDVRVPITGTVAHEIIDAAGSTGASLIVMGTRGLSDWQGLILGSVAHKVVHLAACPVLVVR